MSGPITSPHNPRIKQCLHLQDRRHRRESGLMLVEGFHELSLAWQAGLQVETLFFCPELVADGQLALLEAIAVTGCSVLEVAPPLMAKISYREHPDAWLAIAQTPQFDISTLEPGENPLIILTENLEKPGNLGAILRSADAVGATAVLVCQGRTDVYNPNVVRASKGSLFSQKVVECSNEQALAWLRQHRIAIVAATPSASRAHWDIDMRGPLAIALGAEKEGLSDFWLQQADIQALIPMFGRVNSLNVAQAATLIAYDARRQRDGK